MFLVEDIERRQTNVGDVFLNQSDFGMCHCVPRRYIHCGPTGSCGRVAHQRQRHPRNAQDRRGFPPTLWFRNVLGTRHGKVLPYVRADASANAKCTIQIQSVAVSPQRIASKANSDVTRRTSRYVLLNSKGDVMKMGKRSRYLPSLTENWILLSIARQATKPRSKPSTPLFAFVPRLQQVGRREPRRPAKLARRSWQPEHSRRSLPHLVLGLGPC